MYRIDDEINKREQSRNWSEEIASRVISERSKRTRTKLTVTGSLIVVFVLSFVVGFDISRTGSESPYWVDDFISSVTDDTYYQSETQENLFNFVTYSFNGQ